MIPAPIGDPFLYLEADGAAPRPSGRSTPRRWPRSGVEVLDPFTLGLDDLIEAGRRRCSARPGVARRACRALGIAEALVPAEFPLGIADHLRARRHRARRLARDVRGRRRAKTPAQVEGVRRAQKAADAAMAVAAGLIRELRAGLTSEEVREAMAAARRPAASSPPT